MVVHHAILASQSMGAPVAELAARRLLGDG
jgi:hypothetical protein